MSNMNTTVTTGYGLRHKTTGRLAHIYEEDTEGGGYSNENQYRLLESDTGYRCKVFEVDSVNKAALVLVINTAWYNSTEEKPGWGGLALAEYEVIKIVRMSSVSLEVCDVPVPVTFTKVVEQRRTMLKLAERYLGHAITEDIGNRDIKFTVAPLPEGESVASIKEKCTNRPVLIGAGNEYPELCLGAFELPEEYAALFEHGDGVGIILTHFVS
jgi:hypothetical protein